MASMSYYLIMTKSKPLTKRTSMYPTYLPLQEMSICSRLSRRALSCLLGNCVTAAAQPPSQTLLLTSPEWERRSSPAIVTPSPNFGNYTPMTHHQPLPHHQTTQPLGVLLLQPASAFTTLHSSLLPSAPSIRQSKQGTCLPFRASPLLPSVNTPPYLKLRLKDT